MSDPVNHPQHYKTDSGLEAIEVIEAFFPNDYHLGNAFKYLARAGKKDDEVQDLEKAVWYINRRISSVKDDTPAFSVGDRVSCAGDYGLSNVDGFGTLKRRDPVNGDWFVQVDDYKSGYWYEEDQLQHLDEPDEKGLYPREEVLADLAKHAPLKDYQDENGDYWLSSTISSERYRLNEHGCWEATYGKHSFRHDSDLGKRLRDGTVVPGGTREFSTFDAAIGTAVKFDEDDSTWTKVKENCWRRTSFGLNWSDAEVQENVEEWTVTSVTEPDHSNPPEGTIGKVRDTPLYVTFKNGAWAYGVTGVDPTPFGYKVEVVEWALSE